MSGRAKLLAGGAVAVLVAGLLLWRGRSAAAEAGYSVAALDRGEIADVVGATGVLQAVTTVQVGSQVSGIIESLGADFNSTVKKGQVVARLDPSLFEARVAQMRANLTSAIANVDRSRAGVDDARQKYQRARELHAEQLVPEADLETARANHDGAVAQLKASEAAVEQARANLNQAQVDLAHTVITTPIDGVVIARNVDVGQTVAASFQAPVLFQIANDLARMQVNASIDEADVGRGEGRPGRALHRRRSPGADVPGPGGAGPPAADHRPERGHLQHHHQRREPRAAADAGDDGDRLDRRRAAGERAAAARRRAAFPARGLRGPVHGPGGREREPRRAARRADRAAGGRERGGNATASPDGAPREGRRSGRRGLVFVLDGGGRPQATRVVLGLSDGRNTEVLEGLSDGAQVIVGLRQAGTAAASAPASPASSNPFSPGRPQPRTR